MKAYVFSFLVFVLAIGLVTGQESRVGVLAGVNFQNLNGEDGSGDKLENSMIVGFHGGVNVLMPISLEIYFQPGLLFSTKGAANDDTQDIRYKLNYVELPINLVYRAQLGDNFVLLGFGPYAAMAVNGKVDFDDISRDIEFTNKIESGDPLTTPYMKRFDAGANIFAGYELSGGLFFQLNAQLGLLDITPEDDRLLGDDSMVKNTGFGLSAGFRF